MDSRYGMARRPWAEDHLGACVELGGQQWTIESSEGARVQLRSEDGDRTVPANAEVVRRAYLQQNGGGYDS